MIWRPAFSWNIETSDKSGYQEHGYPEVPRQPWALLISHPTPSFNWLALFLLLFLLLLTLVIGVILTLPFYEIPPLPMPRCTVPLRGILQSQSLKGYSPSSLPNSPLLQIVTKIILGNAPDGSLLLDNGNHQESPMAI